MITWLRLLCECGDACMVFDRQILVVSFTAPGMLQNDLLISHSQQFRAEPFDILAGTAVLTRVESSDSISTERK